MLIQVDVDSTLYDANKLFYELGREAGVQWPKSYDFWFTAEELTMDNGEPCSLEELKRVFRKAHSKEYVSKQKPYPYAAQILQDLVEGYDEVEIAYVSDRNEQQGAALEEWLEEHDFLHNEDQKVVVSKDKRHWMRQHKPEIVIDDRVRTLIMARFELNAQGVSLRHKHNVNLRNEVGGIFICEDWKEIGEVIETEIFPRIGTKAIRVR